MGDYNCSMLCCALVVMGATMGTDSGTHYYLSSSFAIILIGNNDLVALLSLSCLCLVIVVRLFFAVQWQVRIQRGERGSGPPWKITSYMGFYRK